MALDVSVPHSRRTILAGGLGGLAALAVNALGRPADVRAGVDGDVVLGAANASATTTGILNTTTTESALEVVCYTGTAINAVSDTGAGLNALSTSSTAVFGSTLSTADAGVTGGSSQGTGVQGFSGGFGGIPDAKLKTGVYGQAQQGTDGRGVWGYSPTGQGVRGQASSGIGVRGVVTSGVGLSGEATTGYALRTSGRVRLDQSAGQATIASGTSSVVVTPGVDLTTTSAVVATLNGDAGGSTAVKRVAINATANTFTVYLTGNATASVKLAWIVLG